MITARIASPAMKPDDRGTMISSAFLGLRLRQKYSMNPPITIMRIARPGSSMPRPTALAEARRRGNDDLLGVLGVALAPEVLDDPADHHHEDRQAGEQHAQADRARR